MVGRRIEEARVELKDKVRKAKALWLRKWNVAVQHSVMQDGGLVDFLLSEYDHQLEQCFRVIVGVEHGKTLGQKGEENNASRPDIYGGRLILTLEQNLWCSKASCACSIGADRGADRTRGIKDWRRHILFDKSYSPIVFFQYTDSLGWAHSLLATELDILIKCSTRLQVNAVL